MTPRLRVPPFLSGPYWDRTSDLFRVREARYRCANGPSGQRDSNPRPSPWQGDALPAELCPQCFSDVMPDEQM